MAKNQLLLNTTLEEFIEALAHGLGLSCHDTSYTDAKGESKAEKHFVYGYAGLEKLLGISHTTCYRILKSGVIDAAVSQHGKIIVIDADLAIDLLKVHKNKNSKPRGGYRK